MLLPDKLTFDFDILPPNANEWTRMFWAKRHNIQLGWDFSVKVQLNDQWPVSADPPLFERVKLDVLFTVKRRRDQDNAAAMMKPVIDALRHCAVIRNDSYKRLELEITQVLSKNGEQSLHLTITNIKTAAR